ncbi:RidA family protein [Gordonia sp. ABSL1-1]|uniref:RidA family protein n=1 Tax=Gordonia sp. ABSL1-1 TaxID=3053923 RepID=UPI0025734AD3|nr:RidA family protein [Gordonia sp. ABSL1-1]MDL9937689.1 RidA family protein [Gordonia sp. ABSL1-1]
MTERKTVSSGSEWEAKIGYSRAVRVGDHIWVSGTTGTGDTAAEQARTALARISEALEEAGASVDDVVRTRMFVTDVSQWTAITAEHAKVFGNARPASTIVEVAALIDPELKVEIEVDAFIG